MSRVRTLAVAETFLVFVSYVLTLGCEWIVLDLDSMQGKYGRESPSLSRLMHFWSLRILAENWGDWRGCGENCM